MRRLFSSFARGLPGVGLLLLRLVAGVGLILQGTAVMRGQASAADIAVDGLASVCGLLLLPGLWTPVAGIVAAIVEFAAAYFSHPANPWTYIVFGALGISISLLGPGGYSIDARLFGWKRIDIPERKS